METQQVTPEGAFVENDDAFAGEILNAGIPVKRSELPGVAGKLRQLVVEHMLRSLAEDIAEEALGAGEPDAETAETPTGDVTQPPTGDPPAPAEPGKTPPINQ